METKNFIENDLFKTLSKTIKEPFLVLDKSLRILFFNEIVTNFLKIDSTEDDFLNLFTGDSSEILSSLLEKSLIKNKVFEQKIILQSKSNDEIHASLTISPYKNKNDEFIFLTFHFEENKTFCKQETNLKAIKDNFKSVINNEEIIRVIDDVKSLYPFTFIGREKILKQVNQFDELFWIKDSNGKYILANNSLTNKLGVKQSQIVGKYEKSFIANYLVDFYSSIDKYIKDSINCVVLEGIPLKGISAEDSYQTVQIPLSDFEDNVIAIIGIVQNSAEEQQQKREKNTSKTNLISDFQHFFAILDENGFFKHGSKEFCKLFSVDIDDLNSFNYMQVLPVAIIEHIKKFVNNTSSNHLKVELKNNFGLAEESKSISVELSKIFNEENDYEGFSILIEEKENFDDLEKIIKLRGRMFELLIQNNPEPIFIYDTENLRFLEVNEAALNLYGYKREEFLELDLTDLYTPEDIQTLLDSSVSMVKEGKFWGPFKHNRKDGSSVFVEISKVSFKFNERDAHFNIIKDVSESLELEKKNQLFKAAFDNTDDLLFVTDNTGIITFVNNSVLKYLNVKREDVIQSSFTSLAKDNERGTINTTIFHSHIKDTVTLTTELKKSDGSFGEIELTATPILDFRKEIESFNILGKFEAVQPEPKEIIKEVIVEKPVLSEPIKIESGSTNDPSFLSSLFHELLTPINVILGFVQEFTDDSDKMTDDQKEAADIIKENRQTLLTTMNSVVEYSQIQANEFEIVTETLLITKVIDKLHQDISDYIKSNNIEFAYGKISSSLKFENDKKKFQSLLIVLFKIAVRLSGGKKLYLSAYQLDSNRFAISFTDNYTSGSSLFNNNIKSIFSPDGNSNPKDFGVSKLTIKLAKAYLGLLKGNFNQTDCSFIFPIHFSSSEKSTFDEVNGSAGNSLNPEDTLTFEEDLFDKSKNAKNQPEILEESETAEQKVEIEEQNNVELENEVVEEPKEVSEVPEIEDVDIEIEKNDEVTQPENKITETVPQEPVNPVVKQSSEKLDLASLNCLYIEDQVDSQILFKVQMKELKDIKFAVSFEEALPLLDSEHFDFIVMDINLQGEYNGLDALKIIHKMSGYENIPIIAVTAYVLPGDKEKFIATGFNDFISKPIFREKMVESLEKIFLMQM